MSKTNQFSTSLIFSDQQKDLIHHVAFDHHGRRVATSSSDMMVCVWDLSSNNTWIKTASWKSHGGPVWKVVWAHPEFGQILATCSFDRCVNIWEETVTNLDERVTRSGVHCGKARPQTQWKRRTQLVDSRHNVTDIEFAPRHLGLTLATVSSQGVVRIYEAQDIMNLSMWNLNHELSPFKHRCGTLTWSSNRYTKPLLAIGSDATIIPENAQLPFRRVIIYEYHDNLRKWQALDASSLKSITDRVTHPVSDMAFAPSAGRSYHILAIASKEVVIYKLSEQNKKTDVHGEQIDTGEPTDYDVQLLSCVGENSSSYIQIWRLSWNITGTVLTAGSSDGTVQIWKSALLNQWTLIGKLKAVDEVQPQIDDPRTTTSVSALTKENNVYY
ncbi:hypothetical protein AB6A40_004526 [Gnathostoma spinigerum]|uniref:Uncharacterized protein n=1 Tax=Gnathostoma spinigerum TaxID=75299 RepID=A0ABD6EEX0_9BILA